MSRKDKQSVIIITPKGEMVTDNLEAGTLCFANSDKFEAWELDYNQQSKNEKNGRYTQFVSSLNKQPLKIYRKRPQAKSQSTQSIAAQQFDEQLTQITEQSAKQSMLLWLAIIVLSLAVVITVIVLSNMGGGQ